jgi:hypothetical protein
METLDLDAAARLLLLHPEELRRRAALGLVPGAKIGRRWVFVRDDLVAFVRSQYACSRQALRVTSRKEVTACHSTSAEIPGGSSSSARTGDEYASLLGLKTRS